ncbi:MAG: D-alanyl-D-alanine carboxypeptidase family protein [Lysobacteraceae bacterium]
MPSRTHPRCWRLLNAERLEALPAALMRPRARANADARSLARADWLIRRKDDGRFLAVRRDDLILPLFRGAIPFRLEGDLAELASSAAEPYELRPLGDLTAHLDELGLDADAYAEHSGLPLVAEPRTLAFAGLDRYRRPLWLTDDAASAWSDMRAAAYDDGIELDAISGYRSHAYQLGIFRRKRERGLSVDDILAVNAAPGFSEHHSGNALDIGAPDEPPAEESFENTAAFAWLCENAASFNFHLSYPRENPHGIVYEPWHWCWSSNEQGAEN